MRRAVLTISGTVAGLAALFSFKTHVPGVTPVAESSTPAGLSVSATATPAASAAGSASAAPSTSAKKTAKASAPATTRPATPATTTPAATHPTKAPSSSAPPSTAPAKPSGNFTGPNENTQYGPVQVQLTVANGKITAANDVQQPEDSIGANAVSQLNSEVLTAQSANIQAVSGATYTSNGYIASLQQAVDQAGL
jgi:uncharacterized protein with FMN-binding domain